MIKVHSPIPEPAAFDLECRQPGAQWIQNTQPLPARPRDFWSPFRDDLRQGFNRRCGYLAMYLHDGTVDHFHSWARTRQTQPSLAYEWGNMRFVAPSINSSKKKLDDEVLDPFEVQDDWFEVDLQTLVLRATDQLPEHLRKKAYDTIDRFGLQDGRRVIQLRWEWYSKYLRGGITLQELHNDAPLLACAIEKWQQSGQGPLPQLPRPR